jgi:hypothetical protein
LEFAANDIDTLDSLAGFQQSHGHGLSYWRGSIALELLHNCKKPNTSVS